MLKRDISPLYMKGDIKTIKIYDRVLEGKNSNHYKEDAKSKKEMNTIVNKEKNIEEQIAKI